MKNNPFLTLVLAACLAALNATACNNVPESGADAGTTTSAPAATDMSKVTTVDNVFVTHQGLSTIASTPWPGQYVMAVVGEVATNQGAWLVWWKPGNTCQWLFLGGSSGDPLMRNPLDIDVKQASGSDVEVIPWTSSKQVNCSGIIYTFDRGVNQNNFGIEVEGSPAADYIAMGGTGFNHLVYGNGGDDIMDLYSADVIAHGGDGNDKIRLRTTTNGLTYLYGEAGIDCLQIDAFGLTMGADDCGTHPSPNQCFGPNQVGPQYCDTSTFWTGTNCQWNGGSQPGACN